MSKHCESALTIENISFECAKKIWEERILDFVNTISSEIQLKAAKWEMSKMRINTYHVNESGLKKRGGSGHGYLVKIELQKEDTEKIWTLFEQFSNNCDLKVERLENNEKDLERYDFKATNVKSEDNISCSIYLPNEWNKNPCISISVFIGARYRQTDLDKMLNINETDE